MSEIYAKIVKPFSVAGHTVTSEQIARTIEAMAHGTHSFIGQDILGELLPGQSYHMKQEAANRLLQRWRKMVLCRFSKGRWQLTGGAWITLQSAALWSGKQTK